MKKIEPPNHKLPIEHQANSPASQEEEDYIEYEVVQLGFFRFLLPSKKREEVLGDLLETKCEMKQAGIALWKIRLFLILHKALVLLSLLRLRITDYGKSKKKMTRK